MTAQIDEKQETPSNAPTNGPPTKNAGEPEEPKGMRNLWVGIFLFCWPVLVALQFWRDVLGGWYWPVVGAAIYVYLRLLLTVFTTKLSNAQRKGRQDFDGQVDDREVARIGKQLKSEPNGIPLEQLQQFAWSILTPAAVRRRVTDEYTPRQRTLEKSVTIEFSFDRRVHPWPFDEDSPQKSKQSGGALVALTLPKKGQLYDHFTVTDASGAPITRLSQREYRLLAAKTLRALLTAAFRSQQLSLEALRAEESALRQIVRFGLVEQRSNESLKDFETRRDAQLEERLSAIKAVSVLSADAPQGTEFIKLAAELVSKLSLNYAVVAVLPPAENRRHVVRYKYTLVPDLTLGRFTEGRGIRGRLHFLLGTRPVFLSVSARNAAACQSYHLLINASSDLYLGDFDVESIKKQADTARSPQARMEPYWRVRGRRGQHYFHLYTRGLQASGKQDAPDGLTVAVRFFEVPPGSFGRAGVAALACLAVVAAVGWTITKAQVITDIDTQIAAFLLAVPGLAAAWMGFETKPNQLFEGTLTSKLSLTLTFLLSIAASVMLFLSKSGILLRHPVNLYTFGSADGPWTVLVTIAALHAGAIIAIWWQRASYYKTVATRSVGNASPLIMS